MKKLSVLFLLLMSFITAGAQITKTDGSSFATEDGTPGGAYNPRWETKNNNWGYIKNGSTLTYEVKCQSTARYKVSIEDHSYTADATATFAFMQGEGTVAQAIVNGTKSNYGTDEAETTAKLTEGETYTLVVTFNGSGGSWIMNCRNFQFEAIIDSEPVFLLTAECNPAKGGKVVPNSGSYKANAEVKLTATANAYYAFQKWEDESTEAVRTLIMPTEDKTVTAYFKASPLTIPTTDTNPFRIEWASCSDGTWNGSNLDSFHANGTATYTITNTEDCDYKLMFQAASAQDNVQIKMQILQDENVVFEKTQDIENNGGWQNYSDYEMTTTALTQGEYTFVVNFLRADGGYTANVKNIQFKANKPIVAGQMLSLSIDGITMGESYLNPLVGEGHAATISDTFTTLPTIVATFDGVDAAVTMSDVEPTVSGTTLTYVKNISGIDYAFTFTNYHPYVAGPNDLSVQLKYSGANRNAETNVWSNGLYSITNVGDGWENSGFKLSQKLHVLSVPTDVCVKQFIIREFSDNYNPGTLKTITSEGATVYIPFKHDFANGVKYDLVANIENHTPGTDITFVFEGGSQTTGWYELTIEKVAVTTAPELTAQSVTAVNNHAVVALSFDREMLSTEATIASQTVIAEGGSATLVFPVWNLDYDTNYTLTVPAGAAKDSYGNSNTEPIAVAVNIGSKTVVGKQTFDYVVSTVDELTAAIAAVNASNKSADAPRKVIFVKNGTYVLPQTWQDGDSYKHDIQLSCYNVSIVGQSKDGVLISAKSKGITSSTLDMGNGTGNYLENLTIRNTADFGTGLFNAGVAVAVSGGNHTVLKRVAMQSNQDTYVTGQRTYLTQCDIYGTVDFICGGGDIFFDHTNLYLEDRGKGDVICAPSTSSTLKWGYVFNGCTVRANGKGIDHKSWSMGRPWQNEPRAYFLNSVYEVLPSDNGWANMSNIPTHFYEYNSADKDGNILDLSVRGNSPSSTNAYTPVLTDDQAARFTVENVLGGTDSWLPTETCTELPAPSATLTDSKQLTWDDNADARCYVIFKDGSYVANQTTTSYPPVEDGSYAVCAVNASGALGVMSASVDVHTMTGISHNADKAAPVASYDLTGCPTSATAGRDVKVRVVTFADGTTRKIIK